MASKELCVVAVAVMVILISGVVVVDGNHQYDQVRKSAAGTSLTVICSKERSYYAWPVNKWQYFNCKASQVVVVTCVTIYSTSTYVEYCFSFPPTTIIFSTVAGTRGVVSVATSLCP